jgi:outer membrane protein assembly factor BamA
MRLVLQMTLVAGGLALLGLAASAQAQTTRAEGIDIARRDKQARSWPERESPIVRQANELIERGFREGVEDGYGANGPQVVLGGMRSGHGMSFGVGFRKTDIWRERIGVRTTGRMTIHGAYMVDARLDFQGLEFGRSFANFYAKYEKSPRMDFYGTGPNSQPEARSSYLLEDFSTDLQFGIRLAEHWRIGATVGHVTSKTGPGRRGGVPSTTDEFTELEAPGIGIGQIDFARAGGFLAFDTRDTASGTRRGGVYGMRWRHYIDHTHDLFNFRQGEFDFQQYLPYQNESRVIALRAAAALSFQDETELIPVFFMPSVGGNDDLRGFGRYRYHDNHSILLSVEHRWYVFRGLDASLFVDAGKVIPRKRDLGFSALEVSWGFGLRTRLRQAVIMRTDFAVGREGYRLIWTFSDALKMKY